MYQDVFIIGTTGNVGRTLVKQIIEKDMDCKKHVNPTRIIGVASSTQYLFLKNGLTKEGWFNFSKDSKRYNSLDELLIKANSIKKGNKIITFIDVTSSKDIVDFHLKVIRKTDFGIVTANKNPLTLSDYKTFQELIKEPDRYGYRCSVMAGAGVIDYIQDLRDVGDLPTSIEGCFSGTNGFILSELEKGKKFSKTLKEAVERGYTQYLRN